MVKILIFSQLYKVTRKNIKIKRAQLNMKLIYNPKDNISVNIQQIIIKIISKNCFRGQEHLNRGRQSPKPSFSTTMLPFATI